MQTNDDDTRPVTAFSGLGGTRTGLIVYTVMTALTIYMIWVGVTGTAYPRWILWVTTIL